MITVTFDRQVMDTFTRAEAVEAHVLQFALVYVFGVNYEVSSHGKPLKETAEYFNCISSLFWGVPFQTVSKSDGVSLRKKPMKSVTDFIDTIKTSAKNSNK